MQRFEKTIKEICEQDKRYSMMAYYFVCQALQYTIYTIKGLDESANLPGPRGNKTPNPKHVTGKELLEGIRSYVLEQYGPMGLTVLNHWGIKKCADFGHIVFNMIERDLLGRNPNDSLADFKRGYCFKKAFHLPFMPS